MLFNMDKTSKVLLASSIAALLTAIISLLPTQPSSGAVHLESRLTRIEVKLDAIDDSIKLLQTSSPHTPHQR